MSNYHRANTKAQWFQGKFPGAVMCPNCLILHTTETTGWPGYSGGATAPNYTAKPNMGAQRLDWRAHFPDERSARALENHAGGVETNTLNVVQVELVGTCDPAHRKRWGKMRAGRDYIYWPDAPEWALADLADFVADQHKRHGTKLAAPKPFKAYPGSYGTRNGVRMSAGEWLNFYGIAGHQHVPENVHGDPGDLDVARVIALSTGKAEPAPARKQPAKAKPRKPTRVDNARVKLRDAIAILSRAVVGGRRGAVRRARDEAVKAERTLPKH